MSNIFVKDPIDCSDSELNKFLNVRGIESTKGLRKSDKVKIAQALLHQEGRATIIFKEPKKGLFSKAMFRVQRHFNREPEPNLANLVELESPANAPSEASSLSCAGQRAFNNIFNTPYQRAHQGMSTHVQNSQRPRTLPAFDPSPINPYYAAPERTVRAVPVANDPWPEAISYPTSEISDRSERRVTPKRAAPIRPVSKSHPFDPDTVVSALEHIRQPQHSEQDLNSPIPMTRDGPKKVPKQEMSNNKQSLMSQDNSKPEVVTYKDTNKSKFSLKYNSNAISIEDYLKALDRWRLANWATDEKAINMGLQNFTNVSAANNISETLSSEAREHFDTFCEEMKVKLGKTKRQWYHQFQRDIRNKDESCIEFFGKLVSHLKLGLSVVDLTEEHKIMLVEKYLASLHPELRGFLELREPEVTYEDVATVAQKIELARGISRTRPAQINNACGGQDIKQESFNNSRNQGAPFFCELCQRQGHTIQFCYGNANGKKFDLRKFQQLQGNNNRNNRNIPANANSLN